MNEIAVLGGGCFWCTESVFLSVRGVSEVTSGYSGGHVENPSYEQVCAKNTGHIEVVRVVFDPAVIDYEAILEIFFGTHDPTTLDRQGGDVGPQYASAIFCQSAEQKAIAEKVIAGVEAELGEKVVTKVLDAERFWPAEQYHHDYYTRNPNQGYCQVVISPKLSKFRQRFAQYLRA
ncbi:peptide-methionine (S)-S-oxide reductase MsrA [Pollutimonas thiosulfatoxidans]|uniref:Peptide methionine sulfoxide reductase MsrA n=1 Tax=Pollutimonas thiosulfatoxidans TaxID=2028345 RepID=A0A410GCQ6_9BURK|nr:peptide-methionine (S)-S-oxide reductase MsrA [Pollutimonas thiosulfatoxidans]QAA94096.1 peptide-methionine (S)-S-oxide reductase [Pollutimonas thiosulfatoxidans]